MPANEVEQDMASMLQSLMNGQATDEDTLMTSIYDLSTEEQRGLNPLRRSQTTSRSAMAELDDFSSASIPQSVH